jgi:hypothetical protein
VKTLGGAISTGRTAAQTETARFYNDQPAAQWNRTLVRLATDTGLGLRAAARMLAMTNVAGADAMIGCWDAKYHYLFWRPFHAVPRADTDGNPDTIADPTWQPLLNANHPEYPSGHACLSSAITDMLRVFFHTDRVGYTADSITTGTTRFYPSLAGALDEIANARVWGGLHFRHSTTDGATLGHSVSRYVLAHAF